MDLNQLSEPDLLGLMTGTQLSDEYAKAAWAELYGRHRRYLYVVVSRAYGSYLDEDGVVDLVVDAFLRAREWASRQVSATGVVAAFRASSADEERRKVLGWLGTIAEHLFKDRYRSEAVQSSRHEDYLDDWRRRGEDEVRPVSGSEATRLGQALEALDVQDQEVLRLSLPWYDLRTRSFAVPRGEAARLAAMAGISPETFRQRRHRALQKLAHLLGNEEAGRHAAERVT